MPKYVIERDFPGVGNLPADELQAISKKSCEVLQIMGPKVKWQESFVTQDRIYCVYSAPNEATLRDHAQRAGIPISRIQLVKAIIGPSIAGAHVRAAAR